MERVLSEILADCIVKTTIGNLDIGISNLTADSRQANEHTLFIAIRGTQVDGHQFVNQAIEKGCKAIVVDHQIELPIEITQIVVSDTSEALGKMAANFYDHPSRKLLLVGVTGTNGKTTTTTLLHQLFTGLGYACGLISTVENRIGNYVIPSTHTTPDAISLNMLLNEMVDNGCSHCFMEVSSHAVHQKRIAGVDFKGAVFTNITHDHLDYHITFAEYIQAKKGFFDALENGAFALTNSDDRNGTVMLQNTAAKKYTYALKQFADFKGKVLENQFSGLALNINGKEVWTKLIGDFNAYNLLAVFGVSQLLGEDETEVLTILSNLNSVEGRFQYIKSKNGVTAIIDYAHTPDALENVLDTILNIKSKGENLITIIGCGGDRDKDKRPKMAKIAALKSDKVILTSDNPRTENPSQIIDDMLVGISSELDAKVIHIVDRFQAIKTGISLAKNDDIILVAGKGHEKYQEINGVKHPFDDMKITVELFDKLSK
jgi:UDP-N-acetylmuramoyl-L-alanyl-D-glutamate--2,6-diaminopimelate ligase